MAKCLRVCPVYKIKYSDAIVPGWDNIEKFMAWLYEKARQGNIPSLHNDEGNGSDYTADIEIDKAEAKELIALNPDGENEKILQECLDGADPDNAEIHISIW